MYLGHLFVAYLINIQQRMFILYITINNEYSTSITNIEIEKDEKERQPKISKI